MNITRVGAGLLALSTVACAPSVDGTWSGRVVCTDTPRDYRITLNKDDSQNFSGTGTEKYEFSAGGGAQTVIEDNKFDIVVELRTTDGPPQELIVDMTCTDYRREVIVADGADIIDTECPAGLYNDASMAWNSDDEINVTIDGCDGVLTRE